MVSKKDVLTWAADILFHLAFPRCVTASGGSSAVPAPAWRWVITVKAEGRVEGQEREEWVKKGNGAAGASNITGGDSSKEYSRSCRQTELGPYLGENKTNV